jgi:uncharacterized protein
MSDEYRALVHKVSAFCDATAERYRADMRCGPGCSSCCHAWLSVCEVERAALQAGIEALPRAKRAELAARGRNEQARERNHEPEPRCALLDQDGRCAVYEHRPLVCRTQGLPLRYPNGVIPEAAVRERLASGDVTCCPLNFEASVPPATGVLDAERVDQLLGLVNLRFAGSPDKQKRYAISAIAAAADEHAETPAPAK